MEKLFAEQAIQILVAHERMEKTKMARTILTMAKVKIHSQATTTLMAYFNLAFPVLLATEFLNNLKNLAEIWQLAAGGWLGAVRLGRLSRQMPASSSLITQTRALYGEV